MFDNILNTANKYAIGFKNVNERRGQWLEKHKEVKEHLKSIAAALNAQASYNPGFFVDTNHAFNEEINGTCANMPSLTFRSGAMPLNIIFKNAAGERKEYVEEGFHISFIPTINGQVLILLLPHYSTLNNEKPEYIDLAVIDSPDNLTPDLIDQVIARGMEIAYYTSFTGMMEKQQKAQASEEKTYEHAPIGFKRYESTEKVK